jgi:hypothetical protein
MERRSPLGVPRLPVHPAHTNKSAVLIEQPSGAIAFNVITTDVPAMTGRSSVSARTGCYDHPAEDSGVNLTGF